MRLGLRCSSKAIWNALSSSCHQLNFEESMGSCVHAFGWHIHETKGRNMVDFE